MLGQGTLEGGIMVAVGAVVLDKEHPTMLVKHVEAKKGRFLIR